MRKLTIVIVSALVAAGAWFFNQKFEVKFGQDNSVQVAPREGVQSVHSVSTNLPPSSRDTIKIASFNIQVFGTKKSQDPIVMERLASIVRNFDVVAIQEIRATDQDIVPNFVELVNRAGRHYDYVVGPRLGRSNSKEQYAYLFDTRSLEIDRTWLYTVDDPDDLLHREPYVAWFRTRAVSPDQAFTFSLVNIHTDPDETDLELDVLDDVFRAVCNDGRGEDDVIILGDLNVDEYHLGELGRVPGIRWAISGVPTNTRGTQAYDNLVFHGGATTEYLGRSGVYDFLREFNVTLEEALTISDHFPVWAEFSVFEGGVPGRVANLPGEGQR